jgi:MFS family permease
VAGASGPMWLISAGLAVAGIGNGVLYSASTSVALADVGPSDSGEATATLGMLRVIGLALAVAVSTSMVTSLDVAGSSTGLRLALLVAAVITATGLPMAFHARRKSASASTKSR